MADDLTPFTTNLPAKRVPLPVGASEAARAVLATPRPAQGAYPALDDKDGWSRLIASRNKASAEMSAPFAARLKAGVVWGNTYNKFDPSSPFGGYKESGFGREGGRQGLAAYVELES